MNGFVYFVERHQFGTANVGRLCPVCLEVTRERLWTCDACDGEVCEWCVVHVPDQAVVCRGCSPQPGKRRRA